MARHLPTARLLRRAALAAVVLALLAVLLWPDARLVDSATVATGDVRETIEAEGRTRVHDRYVVSAPISAQVERLALHPGDRVRAGQVLVRLAPVAAPALDLRARAEARARVAAAGSQVASAEERMRAADALAAQARRDVQRLRPLAARQLVSADSAERAESTRILRERDASAARFDHATAAHALQAAQAVLAHAGGVQEPAMLELTSPVDGVVLRRQHESAQVVPAGAALLEVGDPAGLEVEVDVLSADAVRLRPGMAVELLHTGGPALAGKVSRVEPGGFTKVSALGVEEQRAWVFVDITSPRADWARLGDAYRVQARFVLRQARAVPVVPASAVFRHDGADAVFRIDGRRARLARVRVGLRGDGLAEVLEGLRVGDRVVVHPDRALEDGTRVKPR